MNRSASVWVCLFVAGVCFAPGCGKSVKLVPVSGKVTLGNQPVSGGQVTLIPDKEGATPGLITGNIDSSGNYKILTNGKDGAPLGKYKVTVTPSMMPSMDPKKGPPRPFPEIYGDPRKTTLSIEVVENPAPGAYDLKMQK
jgi:hypothetical protein